MDVFEFIASVKKLFANENPVITVIVVLFLAIIITIIAVLWAWSKGEVRKTKIYSY